MKKTATILWMALFSGLILWTPSCNMVGQEQDENERVVAQVYNKTLKVKEVTAFIPNEASQEDSLSIAKSYIERWVRESLLLREAEKKVSKNISIDQLVKHYRSTLILSNYEKEFVEKNLDTLVSEEELVQYYDANKEQYQLETTIIRCRFFKLNKDITPKDREFVRKNWKSTNKSDVRYLQRVCKEFGDNCIFDENSWSKLDQIKTMLPSGVINENVIQYNQEFTFKDDEFDYYLYVYEHVADKEVAPFSFIEEQARKFILHKRKLKLLEEMKEQLYEQEIGSDNVKIFVD